MAEEVKVRFRHPSQDLGPYPFALSTSVQQLRDKVVAEWPSEGPLAADAPSAAADVRLILSGKFVDHTKTLQDYQKEFGDLNSETVVTMHVIIRHTPVAKSPGAAPEKEAPKGCGCVIC